MASSRQAKQKARRQVARRQAQQANLRLLNKGQRNTITWVIALVAVAMVISMVLVASNSPTTIANPTPVPTSIPAISPPPFHVALKSLPSRFGAQAFNSISRTQTAAFIR
jgi:hypothetical protein